MRQLAPNIQYIFNFIIIIINVLFYLFVVWRIEYTKTVETFQQHSLKHYEMQASIICLASFLFLVLFLITNKLYYNS